MGPIQNKHNTSSKTCTECEDKGGCHCTYRSTVPGMCCVCHKLRTYYIKAHIVPRNDRVTLTLTPEDLEAIAIGLRCAVDSVTSYDYIVASESLGEGEG